MIHKTLLLNVHYFIIYINRDMGGCYCCCCKHIDFMFKCLFGLCFYFNVCKHITENWGITDVSDRENVVVIQEGGFLL